MKKIDDIDLSSLKKECKSLPESKCKLGLSLIEEIEFMRNTLNKLKTNIEEDGVVVEMCQGQYSIQRANPSLNQYNTTMKNYQSTIKQITELLKSEIKVSVEDEFDNFNS